MHVHRIAEVIEKLFRASLARGFLFRVARLAMQQFLVVEGERTAANPLAFYQRVNVIDVGHLVPESATRSR